MDGTRAAEVLPLLQERLAILPGSRDRRGGPVLLFPTTPRRERAKPEDYRRLLQYLLTVPSDEARGLRFTVIVDMRGATWDSVKPILKVIFIIIYYIFVKYIHFLLQQKYDLHLTTWLAFFFNFVPYFSLIYYQYK